jgi:hypothetical protein
MQVAKKVVDPFAYIRTEMLEVAPICKGCGDFKREVNISELSRQTGVAPVQLSDFLRDGKPLGRISLTRLIAYLEGRKEEQPTPEQAEAVAEAASL